MIDGKEMTQEDLKAKQAEYDKELMETRRQYGAYLEETILMLPPEKKRYWTEKIFKARTAQTQLLVCKSIRERYEAAYREAQKAAHPVEVAPEVKPDKKAKKAKKVV